MQNEAFVAPGGGDDVTISLGQSVRWVNLDPVTHTATSSSEPAGGTAFNSGNLGKGGEFTFTPNVTGTWIYFCQFHPGTMVGARIIVQ
jgi:plastocyanin